MGGGGQVRNSPVRANILNLVNSSNKYPMEDPETEVLRSKRPIKGENPEFGGVEVKNAQCWAKFLNLGIHHHKSHLGRHIPKPAGFGRKFSHLGQNIIYWAVLVINIHLDAKILA